MDGFRTIFFLRRGAPLSGYDDVAALHQAELSEVLSYEELSALPDIEAAVLLYRARMSQDRTLLRETLRNHEFRAGGGCRQHESW